MIDGGGNARLNGNAKVLGTLGIGTPDPVIHVSTCEVFGNVAIGAYAGVNPAPTDGLIVSGNVGIGTHSPQGPLQVGSALVFLQPSGGDDQPLIQAAVNGLASTNGGIIVLMPGPYNIGSPTNSNPISISGSGVKLRGYGGAQPALGGTPATQLLWQGGPGGTVISVGPGVEDIEISDLEIDGNSGNATVGLNVDGVVNSRFKGLAFYNMDPSSGIALRLFVNSTYTLSWNVFERISIFNAWEGVLLDSKYRPAGPSPANPAHNTFIDLNIQGISGDGYGIELGDCDNNSFHMVLTPGPEDDYAGALAGVLAHLDLPESGGSQAWARSNYFYHLQAGGQNGLVGVNASNSYTDAKNFVFGYDQANGELAPQAFTSSDFSTPVTSALPNYFFWVDSGGVAHGILFSTT